ncbi:MAG TPA: DUF4920 domain-containing protein [bacterium]|nr:DUF4920 domain-containing protein [bacterium]
MRTIVAATLLVLSAPAFAATSSGTTFGAKPSITAAPLHLADATKPENLGHAVRVEAVASAVCQREGCWLTLTEGERSVRVSFDEAFKVPRDLAGKTLLVEGTIASKDVSEAAAKHYADDAGKSRDEIAKIKGDSKQFTMTATSVVVK